MWDMNDSGSIMSLLSAISTLHNFDSWYLKLLVLVSDVVLLLVFSSKISKLP